MLLLVLACALALSACGGSSKKPAAKSRGDALIALSKCMRAHGVTNFPDPSGSGGGLNLDGTGINPASPTFRAAQSTCFKLLPGGGPANQKPTEARIKEATAVANCMRRHGVSGFPDPVITSGGPPNIDPSKYSIAEDDGGILTLVPSSIDTTSPAFEKAAKTCNFG